MIRWSVRVDEEILSLAEQDLRRALTVQNARVSVHLDVFSRFRSPRNEARLRRIALGACALGLVLTLVLLVGTYLHRGEVRLLHLALFAAFATLILLFMFAVRLRRAFMLSIDRMLARRATRLRQAWPVGVQRDYQIDQGMVRCHVGDRERFARSLDVARYGLVGEACVFLYSRDTKQNPVVALLVPAADRQAVSDAIAAKGVTLETLTQSLLPASTIERSW